MKMVNLWELTCFFDFGMNMKKCSEINQKIWNAMERFKKHTIETMVLSFEPTTCGSLVISPQPIPQKMAERLTQRNGARTDRISKFRSLCSILGQANFNELLAHEDLWAIHHQKQACSRLMQQCLKTHPLMLSGFWLSIPLQNICVSVCVLTLPATIFGLGGGLLKILLPLGSLPDFYPWENWCDCHCCKKNTLVVTGTGLWISNPEKLGGKTKNFMEFWHMFSQIGPRPFVVSGHSNSVLLPVDPLCNWLQFHFYW